MKLTNLLRKNSLPLTIFILGILTGCSSSRNATANSKNSVSLYQNKNKPHWKTTNETSGRKLTNLNGNIREISQIVYNANSDSSKGDQTISSVNFTLLFNKNHEIIEARLIGEKQKVIAIDYYKNYYHSKIDSTILYGFDGNGLVREKTIYQFSKDNVEIASSKYTQDDTIHQKHEIQSFGDTTVVLVNRGNYRDVYYRDMLIAHVILKNGDTLYKFSYHPNSMIHTFHYSRNGAYKEVKIDPKGNELYNRFGSRIVGEKGNEVERFSKYDNRGILTEYRVVKTNRDNHGVVLNSSEEVSHWQNGRMLGPNPILIYNEFNDLIVGPFNEEYIYSERDEHGNWTKKMTIVRGQPKIIIERSFKYYRRK